MSLFNPTPQQLTLGLTMMRDLLEKPEGWTQGAYARDKNGKQVDEFSRNEATCFCIMGAAANVARKLQNGSSKDYDEAIMRVDMNYAIRNALEHDWGESIRSIPDFNDNPRRTQEDVVQLLNDTIKRVNA